MKNGLIINRNGTKEWYQKGKKHRTDGPAIEYADGSKFWFQNGKLHRTNGPAIEYANGSKFWYQNDKRHRTDGPAVEWSNGSKEWFLDDIEYTGLEYYKELYKRKKISRTKYFHAIAKLVF